MIDWYLKVVRDNYANFSGRARRSEYWYFALGNVIISAVLLVLSFTVLPQLVFLYYIYWLAVIIPNLAVSVRRLHDVGKSGWFYLIVLVPVIGGIWLLILFFTEGDNGPNEYGPDPKGAGYHDLNEIGTPDSY